MRIYGVDFTSAPSRRKPITCAAAWLEPTTLTLEQVERYETFEAFSALLERPGPWVAGCDFPFGQPEALVAGMHWPTRWESYVKTIEHLGPDGFASAIKDFRDARPPGQKHLPRAIDRRARSCSPMMLVGVPVGKMFQRGAPLLLRSAANIWPCRPTGDQRTVLEIYPKLVAQKWIRSGYKQDNPRRQTAAHTKARTTILDGICGKIPSLDGHSVVGWYGIRVALSDGAAQRCIGDASGDTLDAVLATLQTAWATRQPGYGVPEGHELEGWIVDPETCLDDGR
jgi:hypothetical protein